MSEQSYTTMPDQEVTTEEEREQRGWKFWSARLAIAIVVPALFFLALEFGLRLFGVGHSTSLTEPCTQRGQPANCYNLFFPVTFFPPGMIKTPQVFAVPSAKSNATYRIFVLGESAAMGDPDPAYSFSRYLEVMLTQQFPDRSFEVVNTGIVAINSHVLLPMVKDLVKLHPDLFIIYAGNNEVVGPFGSGTVLTSSGMSLPLIRASIFIRSTRIGQLLTTSFAKKKEWGGMEMFLNNQVAATSPQMTEVYSNFENNLRSIVELARNSGASVIVSTIATNLKDNGPFASQHRPGLTKNQLQAWQRYVDQGISLEAAGMYQEAVDKYLAAWQIDNDYAELDFRIARSLLKLERKDEARQHYERARDYDTLRFRADSKINDINRSVAKSVSGVQVVDAAAIFSAQSPSGIAGSDLLYEHVHLNPTGNYVLARALFLMIAPQLAGRAFSDSDVLSQSDCDKFLALTGYDRNRMSLEMLQRIQRAPFTNEVNHSEQQLRLIIDAQVPVESPEDVAAEYVWALRQNPNDRILHQNFGTFLYNFDKEAGVRELRIAQPWDGFPVFTPDGIRIQ